jgi:hypothetical protein
MIGNIEFQWGTYTGDNNNPIVFNPPFPNACLSVVATRYGAGGASYPIIIAGFTGGAFTGEDTADAANFTWFAIGC